MSEGVEVVFLEASRIPLFTKISLLNWRLSRNLSGIDISPSNNELRFKREQIVNVAFCW
jgi:hypothetical protein